MESGEDPTGRQELERGSGWKGGDRMERMDEEIEREMTGWRAGRGLRGWTQRGGNKGRKRKETMLIILCKINFN